VDKCHNHKKIIVAKKINKIEATAFVQKYPIPNDSTIINKEIGPLLNSQQAVINNSILLYQDLNWHYVPAKLPVHPKGGRGLGLNNPTTNAQWMG